MWNSSSSMTRGAPRSRRGWADAGGTTNATPRAARRNAPSTIRIMKAYLLERGTVDALDDAVDEARPELDHVVAGFGAPDEDGGRPRNVGHDVDLAELDDVTGRPDGRLGGDERWDGESGRDGQSGEQAVQHRFLPYPSKVALILRRRPRRPHPRPPPAARGSPPCAPAARAGRGAARARWPG